MKEEIPKIFSSICSVEVLAWALIPPQLWNLATKEAEASLVPLRNGLRPMTQQMVAY
jgi:hypothetical protein